MEKTCERCGQDLSAQPLCSPCGSCGNAPVAASATDRVKLFDEKNRVARHLAETHFELEDGLIRIFRLQGSEESELQFSEPIKLLEVNESTFPSGGRPLQFGPVPASGIPFPTVIVEVTPDEFAKIQAKELPLPRGWKLGDEMLKPASEVGSI